MSTVDDVFSGEAPPPPAVDGLVRVRRWLVLATVLDLLGPTCFTGVPGAAVTLWCWMLLEEEVQRVESGVVAASKRLGTLRTVCFALMLLSAASLVLQIVLFSVGFYDAAFDWWTGRFLLDIGPAI